MEVKPIPFKSLSPGKNFRMYLPKSKRPGDVVFTKLVRPVMPTSKALLDDINAAKKLIDPENKCDLPTSFTAQGEGKLLPVSDKQLVVPE